MGIKRLTVSKKEKVIEVKFFFFYYLRLYHIRYKYRKLRKTLANRYFYCVRNKKSNQSNCELEVKLNLKKTTTRKKAM